MVKKMSPMRLEPIERFTLGELNKDLKLEKGSIHFLWIKVILNTFKHEFESLESLKCYLVDMANKTLEDRNQIPMHPIHCLFRWCVFSEWDMHVNCLKERYGNNVREYEEALDNSLMRFYRDFVVFRDNCQCQICEKSVTLKTANVHHIWWFSWNNWSKHGGPSTLLNLITLCEDCHNLIHGHRNRTALSARCQNQVCEMYVLREA